MPHAGVVGELDDLLDQGLAAVVGRVRLAGGRGKSRRGKASAAAQRRNAGYDEDGHQADLGQILGDLLAVLVLGAGLMVFFVVVTMIAIFIAAGG